MLHKGRARSHTPTCLQLSPVLILLLIAWFVLGFILTTSVRITAPLLWLLVAALWVAMARFRCAQPKGRWLTASY